MRYQRLQSLAAVLSFVLGLSMLALPWCIFEQQAGSRGRILASTICISALWLGLRGMFRNERGTRYFALAGFTCAAFGLLTLIRAAYGPLGPRFRRQSSSVTATVAAPAPDHKLPSHRREHQPEVEPAKR